MNIIFCDFCTIIVDLELLREPLICRQYERIEETGQFYFVILIIVMQN